MFQLPHDRELTDEEIENLFLINQEDELTDRVERYFRTRFLPVPDKSEIQDTGIREYLEACDRLRIVPSSTLIKNLRMPKVNLNHLHLIDQAVEAICLCLQANKFVHTVTMAHNGIKLKGFEFITELIKTSSTLTSLDLSHNQLGPKAGLMLGPVLRDNLVLKELNLSGNELGDAGCAAICQEIMYNKALIKLNLSHNKIGPAGAEPIRELFSTNNKLQCIDLSWNDFQGGGKHVAEGLLGNGTLQHVNLAWTGLRGEGAIKMGEVVGQESCYFQHLDLSHNNLDQAAAVALAAGIEANRHLRTLQINSNPIGEKGARHLFRALSKNKNISDIGIAGCNQFSDMTTMFSPSNPTSSYKLRLEEPEEQAIAKEVLALTETEVGKPIRHCFIDGVKIKINKGFKLPKAGLMTFDFRSGRLPPRDARPMSEDDFAKFITEFSRPTLTPFDKLNFLGISASSQYFTTAQALEILKLMREESTMFSEARISALSVLFGRVVDPSQWIKVNKKDMFPINQLVSIQRKLGTFITLDKDHPTGRYRLHLADEHDQEVMKCLIELSSTERGRTELSDKTEDGETFGIRNLKVDGTLFTMKRAQDLPTSGVLECDYVSGRQAQMTPWTPMFQEDDFQQLRLKHGSRDKLLSKIFQIRATDFCFTGQQAAKCVKEFRTSQSRISVAVALYPRILNCQSEFHFVMSALNKEEQIEVADRLGNANVFDSRHPERWWRLNLASKWSRRVAERLRAMGLQSGLPNLNWNDESYNGELFSFGATGDKFIVPTEGILELHFGQKPEPKTEIERDMEAAAKAASV